MKSYKLRAFVLLLAMSLLFSASACADQFSVFSNATIFWDTLTVTTDPGVSITWLGTSNRTVVEGFDGTVGVRSVPNWNSVSFSQQNGGVGVFGEATDQNLSSTVVWSSYVPDISTASMSSLREGNFLVTGSGNVTFTIKYSLAANRSVNTASLPYPFIETSSQAVSELQLFLPFVVTFEDSVQSIDMPAVVGSVNDSFSQTGTLTASGFLANGQTYTIRADSGTETTVVAPEPSSLALLCVGLFGMVLWLSRPAAGTSSYPPHGAPFQEISARPSCVKN